MKGISVKKEEENPATDAIPTSSTSTISYRSNDPMSIAAILKNPTVNTIIPDSKVETFAESSATGAQN